MKLIRITSDFFVAGLDVEEDRVIASAPIIHYMLDWTVERVKDYAKKRKWEIEEIEA